jgi:hypothetical protein
VISRAEQLRKMTPQLIADVTLYRTQEGGRRSTVFPDGRRERIDEGSNVRKESAMKKKRSKTLEQWLTEDSSDLVSAAVYL